LKLPYQERIERMRNGEKLPCPKCADGWFSALGDPKTTKVFACDKCSTSMILTQRMIDFKSDDKVSSQKSD